MNKSIERIIEISYIRNCREVSFAINYFQDELAALLGSKVDFPGPAPEDDRWMRGNARDVTIIIQTSRYSVRQTFSLHSKT